MTREPSDRTITLFEWIKKSYISVALIPLVIVQLIFISIYFFTSSWSRTTFKEYIGDEVIGQLDELSNKESLIINQQLLSISNTTELFRQNTLNNIKTYDSLSESDKSRLRYSNEGAYYTYEDSSDKGAAVYYSGIVEVDDEKKAKLASILKLQNLMESIEATEPLAEAVYFNTYDSLAVRYPYLDVISHFPAKMNIPSYKFYYEADEEHNPSRGVKWTEAFLDPAGNGWVVSCLAPVYNEDFLEGVVGVDITINTITDEILEMDVPWDGYAILVGNDGNVLALPKKGIEDWGLSQVKEDQSSRIINNEAVNKETFKPNKFNIYKMDELSELAKEVLEKKSDSSNVLLNGEEKVVSWDTVSETGWKLLVVAPKENIYAKVNKLSLRLFSIGTIIIVLLVIFCIVFSSLVLKKSKKMGFKISMPLLQMNGMVEKIGQGDYYQNSPIINVKELKETLSHIINMGHQLGSTNEDLLLTQEELRKKQSDLSALVKSIDDMIMEVNMDGDIINLWTKDTSILSSEYLVDERKALDSIFDKGISMLYKEKINEVINNGETVRIEYSMETIKGNKWFQSSISLVKNTGQTVVVSARDITERKEMEKSIISAKEEAEKASRAKSQFLSSMSHELRTPLNAILGFSQILEMDPEAPLNESQSQSVNEIFKAGNHLLTLINEVLDLSKVESGKMSISIKPVEIKKVVDEAIALVRPMAQKHNVEIDISNVEYMNEYVLADRIRLKQVLINLLSNAVKYNKENGKVILYCDKGDKFIRFNVVDTGKGIAKDDIELVFKAFYRVDDRTSTVEGTGIGLAVAKEIVELMGGNINVESKEGVGSHFWIDLPYIWESEAQ